MTNEEARLTLQDNFGYLSQEHPRILEALRVAIEALSRPSLPTNIDEASERIIRGICPIMINGEYYFIRKQLFDVCIAGAEWMAGQFQEIKAEELADWCITSVGAFEIPEGFYIKRNSYGKKKV